jgi:hypothetical protein
MPSKPGSKKSDDIKILMAALAITTTLGLWNLFATIDKPTTAEKAPSVQSPPTEVASPTQPAFQGKILLGGQAPVQQTIVVQGPRLRNSQQPAPITQTKSS